MKIGNNKDQYCNLFRLRDMKYGIANKITTD